MLEQVRILTQKGIKAVYVGSVHVFVVKEIKDGIFQVLFFSPECLLTELDWRVVLHPSLYQEQLLDLLLTKHAIVCNKNATAKGIVFILSQFFTSTIAESG